MMFLDMTLGIFIGAALAALIGAALFGYHEYQREGSEEITRLHRRISDTQGLVRQVKLEGKDHDQNQ